MGALDLLSEKLPFSIKNEYPGGEWNLLNSDWREIAVAAGWVMAGFVNLPDKAYYKNESRRRIFCFAPSEDKRVVVVKGFPLAKWHYRYRHKKYAFNEATNLLSARERGLPVPEVYGYGMGWRRTFLRWVAVILEYTPFPSMQEYFFKGLSEEKTWDLLLRSIPSFQKLFLAGCNHIDFGPHAIMMSPEGPEKDLLIDFQYARFLPKPSPATLASQLGYFGWSVSTNHNWVGKEMRELWYAEVLAALDIPFTNKIREIIRVCEASRRLVEERYKGFADE